MLTDTPHRPATAGEFVLWGVGASLGLFGLLRLNVDRNSRDAAVDPTAGAAGGIAVRRTHSARRSHAGVQRSGRARTVPRSHTRLPGDVGSAAGRRGWRRRADSRPQHAAHRNAWRARRVPGVVQHAPRLCLARRAHARDRRIRVRVDAPRGSLSHGRWTAGGALRGPPVLARPRPSRRFIVLTVAFLLLFVAASPLYLDSPSILAIASFIAGTAAATLGVIGVSAHAAANVLWTSRGGFLVTQECIVTPLIPIYLAALCAYATTWRGLVLGILATLPIFVALGIVRLLVVALPDVIASPIVSVHAFYQVTPRRGCPVRRRAVAPRRPAGARARAGRHHRGAAVRPGARSLLHARGHLAMPARRSTIHKERSRSFPRSRSVCISRCGPRPSSPLDGGASSPDSRCSCSRRRRASSGSTRWPATPA